MTCLKASLLFTILFYNSCSIGLDNLDYPRLSPLAEYPLIIPEPSGITFGRDYQSYWIVSDGSNGGIYQTTLQGELIRELSFQGDDIEGISYDHQNNVLWIAEEQKNEIVKLNLNGEVLLRKPIEVNSDSNHGLEGIAFLDDGKIWLIHEKSPRLLLMLNHNYSIDNKIGFSEAKDYSGLHFNAVDSSAWIVSDESELLINWNMPDNKILIFKIPIPKAEGVTADTANTMVSIVSDKTAKIYLFNVN